MGGLQWILEGSFSLGSCVQFVYFGVLLIWIGSMRDGFRGIILLLGIYGWCRDKHLPPTLCRYFSSGMMSWMTVGLPPFARLCLCGSAFAFPAYPEPRPFRQLNMVESSPMEVDGCESQRSGRVSAPVDGGAGVGPDVEDMLADLFGVCVQDVLVSNPGAQDVPMPHPVAEDVKVGPHYCPIAGCFRHRDMGGPPWRSGDALRAHVDLHLSGELPGRPDLIWFSQRQLVPCRVCGLSASCRVHGGVHSRCWERVRRDGVAQGDAELPDFRAIWSVPIRTKEHVPSNLIPLIREELGRLLAAILRKGERGADGDTSADGKEAWTHLLMFPKCVLRQSRRGQRPQQAYAFTKALLLRWQLGDRGALWAEAAATTSARVQRAPRASLGGCPPQEVERLVALGRASQATKCILSPGLALDTEQVRAKLMSKFPVRPEADKISRVPDPQPAELPLPTLLQAVKSFPEGAGPGPDGLRTDLLRELLRGAEDTPFALVLRDFVQLLADGRAPDYLRAWMAGGELIGVGKADAMGKTIPLDEDARPIVMGCTWRKLTFKTTFLIDRAAIRDRLVPRQVAVGTKNGADVMVHSAREWILRNCHRPSYVLLQKDVKNAFNEMCQVNS